MTRPGVDSSVCSVAAALPTTGPFNSSDASQLNSLDASQLAPLSSDRHHLSYGGCLEVKGKGSPYSITKRWVPELIPVLGSQPAGDLSHKPGGSLPSLSAMPAIILVTHKRAATIFSLHLDFMIFLCRKFAAF